MGTGGLEQWDVMRDWLGEWEGLQLEHLNGPQDCGPWRKVRFQEKAVYSIWHGLSLRSLGDSRRRYYIV